METKEQKQFYVTVRGERVAVTEEVYRAYIRPDRAERRARRRDWRCVIKQERYGLVRCKEDCNSCPYALAGNAPTGNALSFDAFVDAGYDMHSDMDLEADLIDGETRSENVKRVQTALGHLSERQRYLISEVFLKGRTQESVRAELGISKSAMSGAMKRSVETLKKFLQKN